MKCNPPPKKKSKTSNYHSFIKRTLHANTFFYRKIYVSSNKHYIAPVKINIIFIYRCTGKPLNLLLAASHLNFFLPNTDIYFK